ncbi:MAG: hypothetical protein WC613_04170 [Candidatus Aenigmatarchaeota archaeon]
MKSLKICPSCKKPHIELFIGGQTGNYKCRCGYIGPIVLEVRKIESKKKR